MGRGGPENIAESHREAVCAYETHSSVSAHGLTNSSPQDLNSPACQRGHMHSQATGPFNSTNGFQDGIARNNQRNHAIEMQGSEALISVRKRCMCADQYQSQWSSPPGLSCGSLSRVGDLCEVFQFFLLTAKFLITIHDESCKVLHTHREPCFCELTPSHGRPTRCAEGLDEDVE